METRLNREAKLQTIVPSPALVVSRSVRLLGAGDAPSHYAIRNAENRFTTTIGEGRFTTSLALLLFDSHSVVNETKSKIGLTRGRWIQLLARDVIGLEIGGSFEFDTLA